VDKVADFKGARLEGRRFLTKEHITSREVILGVPAQTSPTQWTEITRAVHYAEKNGISFKIMQIE
jgi:filamentous hemagglutinin